MENIINNVSSQELNGNVVIKLKKGRTTLKTIKTHNTATFNLLYNMLLGLSGRYDKNYLPKYIGVGSGRTSESDDPVNLTGLKSETTITRALLVANYKGAPVRHQDEDGSSVSVIYQGILSSKNISSSTITEIGIFGTELGNTLLARIQLDDENEIEVERGQSLVIEWTFNLKNRT